MHDPRAIREDPAGFDADLARRGLAPQAQHLLTLDERRRLVTTELQTVQAARNDASKAIGVAKAAGDAATTTELMTEVGALKERLLALDSEARSVGDLLDGRLAALPNRLLPEVPEGKDEVDNVVLSEHATKPALDFAPREHDAIGAPLGLDFESAAAMSGARFVALRGAMARLHRALGQLMLDIQTDEHGYEEVSPPLLVRDEAVFGTGQLPKFAEDLFRTTDGRWLIPTAEVSLTNLVRERILKAEELPLRYCALTPCFRSEAGAAGRDTRGMIRQHQFYKVELVAITTPETSASEHERMTAAAESVLARLGLAWRRVLLCAGDTGFHSAKTFDLEVWLPGQNAWREISSVSNCVDFQARRMDARYRPEDGKATRFVHTLNGSGLAVGRALVAVVENYQRADGGVDVPDALRPYLNGDEALR